MDELHRVIYEICNLFSNKKFETESREEALAYYDKGWIVYEHRLTIHSPSIYFQSKFEFSIAWNNNPDYNPLD